MVRLSVRVHPRAARNDARIGEGGQVEVWTTAPPVGGRANEAVRRIIAEWLDVPLWAVSVLAGGRGRTKAIDVAGVPDPWPPSGFRTKQR